MANPASPGPSPAKCPTCDSTAPHLHPAVQFEGEVEICKDPYHQRVTNQNRAPVPPPASGDGQTPLRAVYFEMGTVVSVLQRPSRELTHDERAQIAMLEKWRKLIEPLLASPSAEAVSRPWQDIATAPKDGTEVLLFAAKSGDVWTGHCYEDGTWTWCGDYYNPTPTHWMPIPKGPTP